MGWALHKMGLQVKGVYIKCVIIPVVQFGFAISFFPLALAMLISGMTRGTLGSLRNADELSITSTPASFEYKQIQSRVINREKLSRS